MTDDPEAAMLTVDGEEADTPYRPTADVIAELRRIANEP